MASDLIRDSVFGQLVRLVTGQKAFQYPDETDPSIRDRYINVEKSGNLALHGTLQPPNEADEKEDPVSSPSSSSSEDPKEELEKDAGVPADRVASNISSQISRLRSAENRPSPLKRVTSHTNSFLNEVETSNSRIGRINTVSGKSVDAEKGRDIHLVDWYGPDDPEVSIFGFTKCNS